LLARGGRHGGICADASDNPRVAQNSFAGAGRGLRAGRARAQRIFQCNEIADLMSEIAASGTAVIVRKK
jgi:uncharacterized protein YbjQ (UPF0145 family)